MVHEIRVSGPGRRRALTRHPWIFRDHVAGGQATPGSLVRVVGPDGERLGVAAWSAQSKIQLRFIRFGRDAEVPGEEDLHRDFAAAVARRAPLLARTDAVRLISSEADGFPGLIVDRYGDVCVFQALTPFAEALSDLLVQWLRAELRPRAIVARNDAAVRELEGLPREVRVVDGALEGPFAVREGALRFQVDLLEGQKTGLFLDQRSNRERLGELVPEGARVLDVFSYCGGFALHAARRAARVHAVDDSRRAVEGVLANAALNGMAHVTAEKANAFHRLRALDEAGERYDVVVLDPPAFAKNRTEVDDALRGYREVNLRAFRLVQPGGLVATSSCSYQVSELAFEEMLRGAAADAARDVLILERRGQDEDHPVLLHLPESRYLKCFLLRVR